MIETGFSPRGAFRGAFTALATPFASDGESIELEMIPMLLRRQAEGGVAGVVPAGTTGESPTLREREWRSLVEACVAAARPLGLKVVAGAGSNSTEHAVHLHRLAALCGADASLQVVPYYNRPSQAGLLRHFSTIAESADLPIVLYNIPGRCGAGLDPATIATLAAHPNIVAIKEASGSCDAVSEIRRRSNITVLAGDDTLTLPMMSVGAEGVVSVVSNLVPHRVAALVKAAAAGDLAEARRLHAALFPLSKGLLSLDVNPVPVKAALARLGLDSGVVRSPLAEASEATRAAIEPLLREAGLLETAEARHEAALA